MMKGRTYVRPFLLCSDKLALDIAHHLSSMDLYQHFASVIQAHLNPHSRLVIGFSGGVDSQVLLTLAARFGQQYQCECLAVHVHHGLSGNADRWAEQCAQWAHESGVPFVVEKVVLQPQGKSIEACAREARYQALAQHLEHGDVLLTGQHADDQLETFLLAVKRGSGPKGLSAMAQCRPFANGYMLRPLLEVNRSTIEAFAVEHQLQWVEDESNQDTRFDRNYIRHQVAPALNQRWPHFKAAVQRSAQLCFEQEALLDELLSEKLSELTAADDGLSIAGLTSLSELMRGRLIRMWLSQHRVLMPSRDHLDKIWSQVAMAQQDANPILNLAQGQVRRFNHRLYLVESLADVSAWSHQAALESSVILPDNLGTLLLRKSTQGHMSYQALQTAPLSVIFEPQGLSARPAERGHSRKLKKLFQEYQVPSWQRRRMPIVMCGDKVAAIANLFIDHDFIGQDCELVWDK